VDDNTHLNGLLFQSDSSKGLIFYLHGNAGCIDSWGNCADVYTTNNYDIFILDYRGYGKSQGKISSEKQLYKDIQIVYDSLKTHYNEKDIIIIGYSIGTGLAAHLASTNNPKMLILQAPYFNLPDLAHKYIKIIPSFLIRYKFKTNEYITKIKCPIIIFHGDQDEIIYTESSYKLKELFKQGDRLIILDGQKHNGMNDNEQFKEELKNILK
jgi:pimeloyl-ACP methyl ester carboxylesterase